MLRKVNKKGPRNEPFNQKGGQIPKANRAAVDLNGMAMGLIGVGILVQILLLMWLMKAWKSPGKCVRKKKECHKNEQ